MGRKRTRKNQGLPENLYRSGRDGQYFLYCHPVTGKKHGMGSDQAKAVAAANKLNHILVKPSDLVRNVLISSQSSFSQCIERYRTERQPFESLKQSTLQLENYRLASMDKALGHLLADDLTVKLCSDWLDQFQGNAYTKHRGSLIKVCRFAVSKGLMTVNLGMQTLTAPAETEAKQRLPLSKPWFDLIHQAAPDWLQVAMDLALITLQRRGDLVSMRYSDIRDGHLCVVQSKTEKHGVKASLRIQVGQSLAEVIDRSKTIKPDSCPFIVHRLPKRRVPFEGQQHHAQVRGDLLQKQFKKVRDQLPEFQAMPVEKRPTFHEIRGLGGALYLRQGYSKEYVNLLMGHTTQKMTEAYTDQHQQWTECAADLAL